MKTLALILTVALVLSLGGCGTTDVQTGAQANGSSPVCKALWDQEKALGGTVFAGMYYCDGSQAYVLFTREGVYQAVGVGNYSAAVLPCAFTVSASCVVADH